MPASPLNTDTICAVSTPAGCGGIAVVRVSGAAAIAIVDTLFRGKHPLSEARSHTAHLGDIVAGDETIDEVVATVFRAPHSFTGEEVVEIGCHGSLYIQQALLQALIDAGCRAARAGEFTQRAFLNGRMDLTEAEAVADLIAARSRAEKDLAFSQLRGSVSSELCALREQLLQFTSLIELELDFADHEELEFADRGALCQLADEVERKLHSLTDSFRTGNAIRNGVPVAIVGAPNAGKSTLLNALLGEERAIVSDIRGTTRDTVEDTLLINGVLFRLIDTAGIRETEDRLEQLGIERSRQAVAHAQIVIEVVDATDPHPIDFRSNCATDINSNTGSKTLLRIWNKADLCPAIPSVPAEDSTCSTANLTPSQSNQPQDHPSAPTYIPLSAKSGNVEPLREALSAAAAAMLHTDGVMISNARHYEALCRALAAIRQVQQGLRTQVSGEFLSMDLQDCLTALGEITGQITSDEVLHNIFAHFCIGK